jgi:hypothetical protein
VQHALTSQRVYGFFNIIDLLIIASWSTHPDDGTISWPAIWDIQQSIKERLGNGLPIDDTSVKVHANVLGVFGRYHFKSKLQHILENTRATLQKYMLDPTSKAQVILTMNAVTQRVLSMH